MGVMNNPSLHAGLEYRDRGRPETLLLVPGWATDHRVFDRLDLPFNYLLVTRFSPAALPENLPDFIRTRAPGGVTALGLSLGGVLAAAFAGSAPGLVKKLVLVGVRGQYPELVTRGVTAMVTANHRGFLTRFYGNCFAAAEPGEKQWFNRELRTDYLQLASAANLVPGLELLGRPFPAAALPGLPVRFIHGRADQIAPVAEAAALAARILGATLTVIDGAGHLPVMRSDFAGWFDA